MLKTDLLLPNALFAPVLCPADAAHSAEITLAAPGGIRAAVERLIVDFERRSGQKISATFGSGGATKQRVLDGEAFDVPIVQPPLDSVRACGHVVVASETPLASVAVAVAVRKGTPTQDISTPDAVRRMLLSARAVSCPNGAMGAAAGVSFEATLQQLGIAGEMEPRLRRIRGGAKAMAAIASGEVDVGVTFLSEIDDPGVQVVGLLPEEISTPTAFIGFLSAAAKAPDAARALLVFLSSPEASATYRATGMRPLR
jgi:molybdate transport system substrate-binding protein